MTTIEDAVRDTLAARAQDAPVRLDGRHMLDRVEQRGRRARGRRQALAVAAAVGAVVVAGATWGTRDTFERTDATGPSVVPSVVPAPTGNHPAPQHPTPQHPTPGRPGPRTVTWNELQFEVPSSWTVYDPHAVWPHPLGALQEGPYVGTLPTGSMCSTDAHGSGECSRSHGIRNRHPVDGVVAWIDAAPVLPGMPAADPGPNTQACPAGATTFHAYRLVDTSEHRIRVAVDGCAYGPKAQAYVQQIQGFAVSVQEA
jgi:hypothetical protein